MGNSLNEKLRTVENEHAIEAVSADLARHEMMRRDQAMQMLGAAKYADSIRHQSASQIMQFLITVEQEKLYLDYEYKTFAEFLDNSELSQMSKSNYYRLRDVYLAEGPENYNYFSAWKIPLATRKLLESGDIQIDGDEVIIGGEERVNISESRVIKSVIEKLVKEKIEVTDDLSKAEETIEKQKATIAKGTEEIRELERSIDSINESTPFERALMQTINAFIVLISEIKDLPGDERAERAEADLKTLTEQLFQARDAYGSTVAISQRTEADDLVSKTLAADDDFGDEEEV